METKPQAEHEFLQQMVGEWTYEGETLKSSAEHPAQKFEGTETVRSLGGLWVVGEAKGKMPGGGGDAIMVVTLGYDPDQQKYVGTWIGSMMARLWVYDVTVEGNTINMDSDGPSWDDPTKTIRYRDALELVDPDHRVFTASMKGADGNWTTFMVSRYRR